MKNEFMERMKQLDKVMKVNKEKYNHDKMALDIDDFMKLVNNAELRNAKAKTFFVMVAGELPIVVTVKESDDRPDHVDAHTILERWVSGNYGSKEYDYWDIGAYAKLIINDMK